MAAAAAVAVAVAVAGGSAALELEVEKSRVARLLLASVASTAWPASVAQGKCLAVLQINPWQALAG